ncbi:ARM repeat-containing protein [Macrolepiota fuliginosa MF-IS2]|uniref:non-specific serine/threonine protein kinase n=1 Tax=Macrolepiota fuliginosa MF-IS2 TaxID=1400762 RepID=A0A9P5XGQ6_9AGAR|nr:ARM repeat-containing protein [Macrolepiota fuliginosa MF-IS2]
MGNAHSAFNLTRTSGALDSFIAELGADIVYDKSLGSARFLKTVKCRHRNGFLVVKVFVKPDPGLSLRTYHRRLKVEREALADIANVYSYQAFAETEKAGYIIRQWLASNLYDRISTRPFLTMVEKRWIAFQLLNALRDARNRKVSHGDIKSENILVTSWNWVYLTDFASYKPTYLPLDDPSDFSFFFDTSGRRTCYIAPERFYTAAENPEISSKKSKIAMGELEGKRDGRVTESMDCFSVGCVIAELFLEGAPLFTLSQLFKYREGEYNVDTHLSQIEDEGIRNLIKRMISLDANQRPTFDTLLHISRGTVFPESFYSFLHNYVTSINEIPSNPSYTPPSVAPSTSSTTIKPGPSAPNVNSIPNDASHDVLPSDSDHRLERVWADYESIEPYITQEVSEEAPEMDVKIEYSTLALLSKPFQDILPVELHIPNRDSKLHTLPGGRRAALEDGPALILLALVTANVRNCSLPSSKVRALDVFLALSCHLTDEAKLDRMVPYIVDLLHDESALVRATALRTLMQVLMLVTVITPSNAAIFPEYIIPNIRHLVQDPEVSVRCIYAQCIVQLADTAVRYLEMGQALKAHGTLVLSPDAHDSENAHFEVSYDASMQELQAHIQEHLSALLVDSSSVIKRAVLRDISSLCIFLGRQRTNDVLLSHMITYLNDRDWLLRYAFFDSIVDVAACAGGRSLEDYILPLMIQALSDVEETVVARVLAALTSLCELGLFQKMRIWELMSATLGFLYHPNVWIRQGATSFITSAAQHLPPTDVWCILYPSLKHFLRSDVAVINEQSLLTVMKNSLSRQILDASVQWAMKGDKTGFWRGSRKINKPESPRESVVSLRKGTGSIAKLKSEEDEAQLGKLQQLGMTSSDEIKLMAMREYISKLANATSSFSSRLSSEPDTGKGLKVIGDIELQKLGVVPQTVFLRARSTVSEYMPRPSKLSIVTTATSESRKSTYSSTRTPIMSPPRVGRLASTEVGGSIVGNTGAPFEDLKRRLATINGSGSSLGLGHGHGHLHSPREPKSAVSPIPASSSPLVSAPPTIPSPPASVTSAAIPLPTPFVPATSSITSTIERPGSPTESVVSTANSTTFRPLSRLQLGGSAILDGTKAAPAVGSSKTNAIGLLDAHSKLMRDSEESPERSGRSSPVSVSTIVRPHRSRITSIQPISTYDGQDPGISHLLENLYLDNNRELQNDFGPKIHEGPIRRRGAVRHTFTPREGSSRRTEVSLIANFTSHSESITSLAVSSDHMFFISASDDKTVKIWDTARLERNVTSKPRHTYGQHHARVKCVCMLEGTHCFASAADDGSVHVVRVHVTQSGASPKYGKLQVVREYRVDKPGEYVTCMIHYNSDLASNLILATTHSTILILDLRTMRVMQRMENPRQYGPITCICLDRKRTWIIVGTSTGVLTLWDRRFGLMLKSWHVGVSASAPGRSIRVHQCVVHPAKGRGKWIMVAIEASKKTPPDRKITNLVEVWDIEKSILVESFVTRTGATSDPLPEPQETVGTAADMTPTAAIAALVRARQTQNQNALGDGSERWLPGGVSGTTKAEMLPSPTPDVRAMVVGLDFGGHSMAQRSEFNDLMVDSNPLRGGGKGFMITASEDRKIRFWDMGKIERTAVLSGLESEQERPTYSSLTNGTTSVYVETSPPTPSGVHSNRPAQRMSLITHNQQNLLKNHQDVITALTCIDSPFRGGIVSGDRTGVIKVWRVDQLEA